MRKQDTGNMVAEKARELYTASSKLARRGSSRVRSFMHDQPVVSVVTGVVAGILLALALRPRE